MIIETPGITVPAPKEDNRWYICRESKIRLNHWECEQKENFNSLAHIDLEGDLKNPRTIAVPVPSILPKVFDFMIINNALKQTFEVKK